MKKFLAVEAVALVVTACGSSGTQHAAANDCARAPDPAACRTAGPIGSMPSTTSTTDATTVGGMREVIAQLPVSAFYDYNWTNSQAETLFGWLARTGHGGGVVSIACRMNVIMSHTSRGPFPVNTDGVSTDLFLRGLNECPR